MTYDQLLKHGKQVVQLAILKDDAGGDWCPYAVTYKATPRAKPIILIHYINHTQEATCPYADVFGKEIDPRKEGPYSLNIVRKKNRA